MLFRSQQLRWVLPLTADFDARTACYVRFYHEKFQKNNPDLLAQIKRATKSEMQSKDDVDSLRGEICKLKDNMQCISLDFDRRMSEMSYEYNRRISTLSIEYDKLVILVEQLLASKGVEAVIGGPSSAPDMLRSLTHAALAGSKHRSWTADEESNRSGSHAARTWRCSLDCRSERISRSSPNIRSFDWRDAF